MPRSPVPSPRSGRASRLLVALVAVGLALARADAIHAQQVDAEMGTARWSLLFRPGTYGTDAEPLQIKVGYYTEVAGLGASPSDTVSNGKVEVDNRCLTDGPTQPYCVALNNFWRSLSNLTIQSTGPGRTAAGARADSDAPGVPSYVVDYPQG